ncbi:MAG: 8-amino-7-oxononanoate synthase [Desulfobacteraceae bacterium]|nr:8-amino-7-oxononanoate synthase [Desulfobacteraceae bacterium]
MDELNGWLGAREVAGNLRELRPVARRRGGRLVLAGGGERTLLDFSSNDYLGLSEHPEVVEGSRRALEEWGAGSGAARLMSGDLLLAHRLEEAVASLKGQEAALLFGSGYLANAGIIPALVGREDVIFADRLDHASIYDGCRLSGARLRRFRHNDLSHLEELLRGERGQGQALIVVESLYSMDGDRCPLRELVALKERHDCLLLVDEAHATGVFGANGGGLVEEEGAGAGVDLVMGTFGKALGSYGAYAAGSATMVRYLLNRARSFIFSTALPPAVLGASMAAVELVRTRPELRAELHRRVAVFKEELRQGGWSRPLGPSQIVPVPVGGSPEASGLAAALLDRGLYVTAVRPPTVPEGTARLRISITRHHGEADLREAVALILAAIRRHAPSLLA